MNDNAKKQVPLRLSPKLYAAIAAWAEDDFRSVNGQIEYLLTECVRQRKRTANTSARRSTSRPSSISSEQVLRMRKEFVSFRISALHSIQEWSFVQTLLMTFPRRCVIMFLNVI